MTETRQQQLPVADQAGLYATDNRLRAPRARQGFPHGWRQDRYWGQAEAYVELQASWWVVDSAVPPWVDPERVIDLLLRGICEALDRLERG